CSPNNDSHDDNENKQNDENNGDTKFRPRCYIGYSNIDDYNHYEKTLLEAMTSDSQSIHTNFNESNPLPQIIRKIIKRLDGCKKHVNTKIIFVDRQYI